MSARGTSTIRIGAGGIMLPNHAPLVIAEQFGTLESLFPGRVDLGLGRAPGTDQAAAYALRRNLTADENQFPNDVLELQGYFKGGERPRCRAIPGEGLDVPVWILGSSLFGAQLAAMLGLPYAFASHFAPADDGDAIRVYRETFRPSAQLDRPYVMLGFNAFAADSDEEARAAVDLDPAGVRRSCAPASRRSCRRRRPATPRPCRSRRGRCCAASCPARRSATRTPRAGRSSQFVDRYRPDELMVTAQIHDHQARLKSYLLLMEAVRQPAASAA